MGRKFFKIRTALSAVAPGASQVSITGKGGGGREKLSEIMPVSNDWRRKL